MRILYDNAADRATVTASTTAGTLAAANLLTDIKSSVWRSTAIPAAITLVWTDPEVCNMAALPFCNLTSTATIRARGYTNAADASPAIDTGALPACAYAPLGMWEWGMDALGVNAYSYGGGTYGRVYFAATAIRKLVIDIADPDNTAGYIEAARVVAGAYWEADIGPEIGGPELTPQDTTKQQRSDAGDLRIDTGTRHRSLQVPLQALSTIERAKVFAMLRGNGMSRSVFISIYPENTGDPALEQENQVWGKLARSSAISTPFFQLYGAALEIEEN